MEEVEEEEEEEVEEPPPTFRCSGRGLGLGWTAKHKPKNQYKYSGCWGASLTAAGRGAQRRACGGWVSSDGWGGGGRGVICDAFGTEAGASFSFEDRLSCCPAGGNR